MNVFNSLASYAGKYSIKSSRKFSEEEKSTVKSATVVPSEFGLSVCFFMKNGAQKYIPLSTDSAKGAGESIDLDSAEILMLGKEGSSDILRIKA